MNATDTLTTGTSTSRPQLSLRRIHVNRTSELLPYRMDQDQARGLLDLLRFYGPRGVFRMATSYAGPSGGLPSYAGHGTYFDYDHVLRNLTGRSGFESGVGRTIQGGGKGHSLSGMFASTLGELVERIMGCFQGLAAASGRLRFGSRSELRSDGLACVGPDDLSLFAPEQHADRARLFDPFTDDSLLQWIEGRRMFSGDPTWIPAQLVLLHYERDPREALIGYSSSGGLACHTTPCEARYRGIVELFERDAMNISWYCRIPPRRIEFDRAPRQPALRKLLHAANGLPATLRYHTIPLDTPELPTVTVMSIDPWLRRFAYCVGSAADLDADAAIVAALTEYGQSERNLRLAVAAPGWNFSRALLAAFDVAPDADPRELDAFFKVLPYYGHAGNVERVRWYAEGAGAVKLSELPVSEGEEMDAKWATLANLLSVRNIDPVVFDFTPPQFDSLSLVKVFIPELTQPMSPALPLLGHRRFHDLPRALGYADRQLRFRDLNTDPLPYP